MQVPAENAKCFGVATIPLDAHAEFRAESLHFIHEIQDQLESGGIDLTGDAQMFDAAERAQCLFIEFTRHRRGADQTDFLIMEDGLRRDARETFDDIELIGRIFFGLKERRIRW